MYALEAHYYRASASADVYGAVTGIYYYFIKMSFIVSLSPGPTQKCWPSVNFRTIQKPLQLEIHAHNHLLITEIWINQKSPKVVIILNTIFQQFAAPGCIWCARIIDMCFDNPTSLCGLFVIHLIYRLHAYYAMHAVWSERLCLFNRSNSSVNYLSIKFMGWCETEIRCHTVHHRMAFESEMYK